MKKFLIIFLLLFPLLLRGQAILRTEGNFIAKVAANTDPEMINIGTFPSSSNWDVTGGVSITTGTPGYAAFNDITGGYLQQTSANMKSPIVINVQYDLTFTVSGTTGGGLYFSITECGGISYVGYAEYNNGNKTVTFTAPAEIPTGGIRFNFNNAGDSGGHVANISLKPHI